MRVLLDANLPHDLRHHLTGHEVETSHYAGLDHLDDAALLDAMEGIFDVLITGDGSLPYQQDLAGRAVCVIVVRGPGNKIDNLLPLVPVILTTLASIPAGAVREVVDH